MDLRSKVPYKAAPPLIPLTFSEKIHLVLGVALDTLIVLLLSIPNWIDWFVHLFIPRSKKSIAGQTAVITGGGNGIGRCIAIRLAEQGCNVALLDIEEEAVLRTAHEISNAYTNVKIKGYHIDVTDYKAIEEISTVIERDLGPVDILINNAGLMPLLSLREGTEREIERIVSVNVTANFYTTRTFLPGMLVRRRGHIVTVSSVAAFHPIPRGIIYSATKCAMHGFMEALAEEVRIEGYGDCVHFTSLHPYFVSTRKDVMDAVKLRFQAVTPEHTADKLISGMLRNQFYVTVPHFHQWFTTFLRFLPRKNQQLVRDFILREDECRVIFLPKCK